MQQIRKQIDGIDKEIIKLLGKRIKLVLELSNFKKKESLAVQDKKREAEILKKLEKQAKKEDIDSEFISKLYKDIFKESRKIQS